MSAIRRSSAGSALLHHGLIGGLIVLLVPPSVVLASLIRAAGTGSPDEPEFDDRADPAGSEHDRRFNARHLQAA